MATNMIMNAQSGAPDNGQAAFRRTMKLLAEHPTCQHCRKGRATVTTRHPHTGDQAAFCRRCADLAVQMNTGRVPRRPDPHATSPAARRAHALAMLTSLG